MYNCEIDALVEAAGDKRSAGEVVKSGLAKAGKLMKTVLSKIWAAIRWAFRKLIDMINGIKDFATKPIIVTEYKQYCKGTFNFDSTIMRYADNVTKGNITDEKAMEDYLDNPPVVSLNKGDKIDTRGLQKTLIKYEAAITRLENNARRYEDTNPSTEEQKDKNSKIVSYSKYVASVLRKYAEEMNEVLKMREDLETERDMAKEERKNEKIANKIADKAEKRENKRYAAETKADAKAADKYHAMNDSVEVDDITLSARLILEAAELLREESEEADDEYPTDVNGGEGQDLDYEEIKDLVGDDKEAMSILTDDDVCGGKAITESVIITF
jgi:hypothetical protein